MTIEKNTTFHPILQKDLDKLAHSWMCLVSSVSHHLTTPLVTLRMSGEFLQKVFPDLLSAYKLAIKNMLIIPTIDDRYLKASEKFILDMEYEITQLLNFLSLLRPYNQKLISNSNTPPLNMRNCIESVLKNYPFSHENDRQLVHVDYPDEITPKCDPTFIEYLLVHLLNNALRLIHEVEKGEIFIWTEECDEYAMLHFKDTAKGMDDAQVACVFQRFFSKRNGQEIPGLGYCRLALLQMGGDIVCHSVPDAFTHFVVKFPKG